MAKGQTGYPIVDAAMRELWITGYMHNRARMVVGELSRQASAHPLAGGRALVLGHAGRRGSRQQQRRLAMGRGLRRRRRALFPRVQSGSAGREIRSRGRLCAPLCARNSPGSTRAGSTAPGRRRRTCCAAAGVQAGETYPLSDRRSRKGARPGARGLRGACAPISRAQAPALIEESARRRRRVPSRTARHARRHPPLRRHPPALRQSPRPERRERRRRAGARRAAHQAAGRARPARGDRRMARRLAGRRRSPRSTRPLVAVFAGNHGVVAQGVSAFPAERHARRWCENFKTGGAAINQICKAHDIGLKVYRAGAGASDAGLHARTRHGGARGGGDLRLWHGGAGGRASICSRPARWASATRPARRRSTPRSTAGRRRAGRGGGRASTTPGSRARTPAIDSGAGAAWRRIFPIRWRSCAGSAGARSRR